MNKSTRTIIAAAAIAGLYAGSFALKASASTANAGTAVAHADDKAKSKDSCTGKDGCGGKEGKAHDCKGKNECKGKGGCKSGDNGCKGKNTCKGKGGCATPAEKPAEKPKTA